MGFFDFFDNDSDKDSVSTPGYTGDYDYGPGNEPSHEDSDFGDTCGDTGDFDDGSYF